MTVHVFTMFDAPFRPVADITLPALRDYCAKHGYFFSAFENPKVKCDIVWERLRPLFSTEADWSVYLDTDVLITNPDISLESIISSYPDSNLITGSDIHGLNDGILFVKNDWNAFILISLLESMHGKPNVFCAQDALRDVMAWKHPKGIGITVAPQRLFNSYLYSEYGIDHPEGEWKPGDFSLHLPGRTNERRVEIFKSFIERIR